MSNGFDRLAKPYRWMEYISFGKTLERCRFRFLGDLSQVHSALVLGDGDGRFAAQLLRAAPACRMHAIDGCASMLLALKTRCGADRQVFTHCADLTLDMPSAVCSESFDLVATHFFLDCLTTAEVGTVVQRIKPLLRPGAAWVVSEFEVPGNFMRVPAALIVRMLYLAFHALTGLRTRRLPEYREALKRNGFACRKRVPSCGGLLVSELWAFENAGLMAQ